MTGLRTIHSTDADLVNDDFAALFDRHAAAVHRYLARRVGRVIADDLLAQTFLVAFERRTRYDRSRPDARPWLYGIATNLLRRHHRDEVRQYQAWARTGVDPVLVECPADRIADRVDADARSAPLAAALAALRPADREVLLLFAWGELSYAEIADALGIPVGTVRSRLSRARAAVRTALSGGDPQ
jgi:RNA polymerase sigma-70 factor (ECF subfamily)